MRARLLVLADGGQNRRARHVRDYRQQAIVAEVTAEHPRAGIAWERFTAEGPLALLPFRDRYALVWSVRPASAAELLGLSDSDFLARLREIFGGRLGDFTSVGPRSTFPLSLRHGKIAAAPEFSRSGTPRKRYTLSLARDSISACATHGNWLRCCLISQRKKSARPALSPATPVVAASTATPESASPIFW